MIVFVHGCAVAVAVCCMSGFKPMVVCALTHVCACAGVIAGIVSYMICYTCRISLDWYALPCTSCVGMSGAVTVY